jgi:hypothetical protein
MKKSILFLVGGIVAGVALCLTAVRFMPLDIYPDEDLF